MKRKKVFIILTFAWMAFIFFMSSRDADVSAEDSHQIGLLAGKILVPGFNSLPENEQLAYAEKIDFPIRKCAHATEYAVLGVLSLFAFRDKRRRRDYLFAWLFAVLYAVTDEFHQLFVPGRSGEFRDVCIDAAGALAGLFVTSLAVSYLQRKK